MLAYERMRELESQFAFKIAEVLEHLPGEWATEQPGDCCIIATRPDGLALRFWLGNGRVECVPRPPNRHGRPDGLREWGVIAYNAVGPTATFAFERKPEQAARDVVRKVLEPYEPLYARILQRQAEDSDCRAKARATAATIAAVCPGATVRDEIDGQEFGIYAPSMVSLRVYGDSVRFEYFSTTPEKARRIVEILAEKEP